MGGSRASRRSWLPWSGYGALGALGATLSWVRRDQVWSAPIGPRLAPEVVRAERLGLLLALALVAVTVLGTRWLVRHTAWARALHRSLRGPLLGASTTRLLLLALASACAEELFFRAALLPWVGLPASSLLFGVVHVAPREVALAWMLWATLMGLLFGLLFVGSGSLLAPLLAHAAINYENMKYLRGDVLALPAPTRLRPQGERWRRL